MSRPQAVTFSEDQFMFWTDPEKAAAFVNHMGGNMELIPEDIEESEDDGD